MLNQASKCKSCGAKVLWLRNAKTNKVAPLDAQPNNAGNCVLIGDAEYAVLSKMDSQSHGDAPRYTSHFQTCVSASQWRSK